MDANAAEHIIERLAKQSALFEDELAEVKAVRTFLIGAILAECGVDGDTGCKRRSEQLLDRLVAVRDQAR